MEQNPSQNTQTLLSTSDLAKRLRAYAWTSLIVGIIVALVTFGSTIASLNLGSSTDGIFSDFASALRSIYFTGVVGGAIILVVFFMLASEFKNLGERSPIGSYFLATINKILIVSIGFQIVSFVVGYFSMQQMISFFESIDFETVTIFQLESLMTQMESMGFVSDLLNLIPMILELFAFYKFREWVNIITAQYSYHGSTKDLTKTSSLIVLGNGLMLGAEILGLIPSLDLGGLISFGGLIVMLVGYFQTATILDSGFYKRKPQIISPPTATYTPPGLTIKKTTYRAPDSTPQNKICPTCGKIADLDTSFCSVCGARFES